MRTFYYLLLTTGIFGVHKTFHFVDNFDGTIYDATTGLMWQKDMGEKITWNAAMASVGSCKTGGYDDWRMPNIKELFSLIRYSGQVDGTSAVTMFVDTESFVQPIGNTSVPYGREIDAQTWSVIKFKGTIQNDPNVQTSFGVNFVDGRVKNYPIEQAKFARYVRGNSLYSKNDFSDNGDGTVSDSTTGLMWAREDSGEGLKWEFALAYCEKLNLAGYSDWRLPTIKELNSIVDYNKCQDCAAINETVFKISTALDPDGNEWYPYFWSSTTLRDGDSPGREAMYQTFGRALGILNGTLIDAHGAGAIRGDPKTGKKSEYPEHYTGYQGDVQYVYNYVRPVRDIATSDVDGSLSYPIVETNVTICYDDKVVRSCPMTNQPFYGQDGNYLSVSYTFKALDSTGGLSSTGQTSGSNGGLSWMGVISLCLGASVIWAISLWTWCNRRKKAAIGEEESVGVILRRKQQLNYFHILP